MQAYSLFIYHPFSIIVAHRNLLRAYTSALGPATALQKECILTHQVLCYRVHHEVSPSAARHAYSESQLCNGIIT